MAQTQQKKKSEYDYGMNIDDLLNESDDDDDDHLLSGVGTAISTSKHQREQADQIHKFKQKEGITSQQILGSVPMTSTPLPQINNIVPISTSTLLNSIPKSNEKSNHGSNLNPIQPIKSSEQSSPNKSLLQQKVDQALISSDDDSDHEDIEDYLNKIDNKLGKEPKIKMTVYSSSEPKTQENEAKKKVSELGEISPSKMVQQPITDVLEAVERNERLNEVVPDKMIDSGSGATGISNQLLSFDNKFYNVQKKLIMYQEYPDISRKLQIQKNHQFSGVVSAMIIVQDYIFIGNSQGIIRVFDLKSQKEMKPLMDENLTLGNKVTCVDISSDGGFLISGYKKGQVALWDLVNYKLLRFISDIHTSDVVNAKIYHTDENENIYAVSCEDSGKVQLIRYNKKSFIGGYSSEAQFLFKTRLRGTATVALYRKNDLYPHPFCDSSQLVAFGSLNEVVVCTMRPIKEIFQIPKPSFCKEKSIPYIDWGFGLTPGQRERTVPIMAIAWDRLIQLVYINEQNQRVQMDGFYYSEHEINSIYFVADSILFALVNEREIKILYTTKFYPGYFNQLENQTSDDLLNNPFDKVIQVTAHAEIEKGFEIQDIKGNLLSQMVMNYNQSVRKTKQSLFFLCGKNIIRGRVFSWKEYLDHIKFKENYDWLTVLKVALEIYNGEVKGYAKVPDQKEIREGILKNFMKDMIKDSVQQVLYKYNSKLSADIGKEKNDSSYQADSIAIKVAIEFCLSINSTFFLFNDIYQIFYEQGLENKFIANLEPFVLAGQFRKEIIPEKIIKKLLFYYEERNNFKTMERIIQQIDLSDYPYKEELMVTCQFHCLISALLYLMQTNDEQTLGCMQVLNTMLSIMRKAKTVDCEKDDILLLSKTDSVRKFEVEKSRTYIGYKLLFIIKMFLEGKSFPTGYLPPDKYRMHVYDILNFVTQDQFLEELIQFDSEYFFRVIAKLFQGQPIQFIQTQKEYFQKQMLKGFELSLQTDLILNNLFYDKAKVNPLRLENYYRFILNVQAYLYNNRTLQPINIDLDIILSAITTLIQKKDGLSKVDEENAIFALRAKKPSQEQLDKIMHLLDTMNKSYASLRIYLYEKRKDFVQSFKLNLGSNQHREKIFNWIHRTLDKLQSNPERSVQLEALKETIQKSIKDLMAINIGDCVSMIDRWFEDSYQEQLILNELALYPEVQYNYLRKFISQYEEKVQQTINEATYSNEKRQEAQRYIQYLILYTKLLCKFAKNEVHENVKKDFYPVTECLEICRAEKCDEAVAILLKRNGNYLESLNTYLSIIESFDLNDMLKELVASVKQVSGSKHAYLTQQIAIKWEYMQCQKLVTVHQFDQILNKAVKIAESYHTIIGEEGWFTILEYLAKFKHNIQDKLEKQTGKQMFSAAQKHKIDLLKDFLFQRKNHVLRLVPTWISLESLTQRLNLDFRQIKQLYDFKVKAFKNNKKYLKLASNLQEKELLKIQYELYDLIQRGYPIKEDLKCCQCDMALLTQVQKMSFKQFMCKHTYHSNCVPNERKCVHCIKQDIEIQSKEELRKTKVGRKSGGPNKTKDQIKEENQQKAIMMQGLAHQAFQQPTLMDKTNFLKEEAMIVRRLEAFDQQLESQGLSKVSFY